MVWTHDAHGTRGVDVDEVSGEALEAAVSG